MRFTGLSEFLVYGLLFAAIIGFNIFKQVLAARREQQRRRARAARQAQTMEPMPQDWRQPAEPPPVLMESDWGRQGESESDEPIMVARAPEQPLEVVLAREREREREQRRQERLIAVQQSRAALAPAHARPRRRLLHTRRELRHGIVLMTVLGPCRALQPYDQDHG